MTLSRFLEQAEARSKAASWEANEQSLKRDLPAALSLLRAFAAVVEEEKKGGAPRICPPRHPQTNDSSCRMCDLLKAADLAVAALSEEVRE